MEEIDGYQRIIDGAHQVEVNYKPTITIDPKWEIIETGKICDLMTGGTPKSTVKEYYKNGNIKSHFPHILKQRNCDLFELVRPILIFRYI